MKKLINIINESGYNSVSYSNDIFTIFLSGDRYYEIKMSVHTEILEEDEGTNFRLKEHTITIKWIMNSDLLKDVFSKVDGDFEELELLIADHFYNEF